jgi:polar amino acid transport system substrate-binding protein
MFLIYLFIAKTNLKSCSRTAGYHAISSGGIVELFMASGNTMIRGGFMKITKLWMGCTAACVVLSMFLAGSASAGKTMVVAVNANMPPMVMKDAKGNVVGYEIDLMNAMAREAGFQVRMIEVPWRKIFKDLDAGKYNAVMASVNITQQRKEKFDFSEPYFTAEQLLVVNKNHAERPFDGEEVAVFKLTTGADTVRRIKGCKMAFYTVEETEKAFRDLAKGDLAGVFCDSPLALSYTNGKYNGRFIIAGNALAACGELPREEYGIMVKKGDVETLALINKGLQAVKDKDIDTRLKEKWIKF